MWNKSGLKNLPLEQPALKVDFHCQVLSLSTLTHIIFYQVNKIEARLNMMFCEVLFLRSHATFQGIYFICEPKFYARMHIKIKWQWKSTLRRKTPHQLYLTLGLSIKVRGLTFTGYFTWTWHLLCFGNYSSFYK